MAIRVLALAVIVGTMPRVGARTFPGVNGLIAFDSAISGPYTLMTMNGDGTGQTLLSNFPGSHATAAWSPDGTRIAFASAPEGPWQIYVMNADGTGVTRLTNNSDNETNPTWSPDGRRIAFTTTRDGSIQATVQIYVMNADGSGQTRLTAKAVNPYKPYWSPDGSRILASGARSPIIDARGVTLCDACRQVVLALDAASGAETILIPGGFNASWSPDGTKIAYQGFVTSQGDFIPGIYVDGTRLTTEGSGAVFSPDGTKIAFQSNRDGNWEIYVMNADGSDQTRLTNNTVIDAEPDWQRQPDAPPPGGGGPGGGTGGGGTGGGSVPPPNTPAGLNVPVVLPPSPAPPAPPVPPIATLTFADVTQAGETDLTIRAVGPPPPEGFALGTPPTYFDFTTTATFVGTVTVCIDYSGLVVHDPASLHLFHYEPPSSTPVDSTISNDTVNRIICGQVTSLSPFAVLEPEQPVIRPWAALTASATIDPRKGDFDVRGIFTLGEGSDGIDFLKEDVLIQIGPFTATIPAGAFRRHGSSKDCDFDGRAWGLRWRQALPRRFGPPPRGFEARMHAVHLEMHLGPLGKGRYAFDITGRDADLEGITNPVIVGILIANDGGSTQVTARFPPPPRDHWRNDRR